MNLVAAAIFLDNDEDRIGLPNLTALGYDKTDSLVFAASTILHDLSTQKKDISVVLMPYITKVTVMRAQGRMSPWAGYLRADAEMKEGFLDTLTQEERDHVQGMLEAERHILLIRKKLKENRAKERKKKRKERKRNKR
jgi:hypothetical protein